MYTYPTKIGHFFSTSIFVLIFTLPAICQEITLLDKITGSYSHISDFEVNDAGQRFYMIERARDSVVLNGQVILVDSVFPPLITGYDYVLSANNNGSLNFIKEVREGGELVLTENSIFLFLTFLADTLLTSDTSFIKNDFGANSNMVAIEYDFEGSMLRSKQWVTPAYNNRNRLTEITCNNGDFYLSGFYELDTLQFDDHFVSGYYNGQTFGDIYFAKINGELECEWLTSHVGNDYDASVDMAMDEDLEIISTGGYSSGMLYCQEDTIFNPLGIVGMNMYIDKRDKDGDCLWLRSVEHGAFGIGSDFLTDGSVVVAGQYEGLANFGDTILVNPNEFSNSFIAKYSTDGDLRFVTQLGEGDWDQNINGIATTPTDGIWVCGDFGSDPLHLGDITLPLEGETMDAFFAKYNKHGYPMFATSIKGIDYDVYAGDIKTGKDEKLYSYVLTYADSVLVGDSLILLTNAGSASLVFEIKDEITDVEEEINIAGELIIFPNPISGDVLNYEFISGNNGNYNSVNLFSIYGQLLGTYNISGKIGEIKLPELSSGIYFLKFKNENNLPRTHFGGRDYIVKKIIKG